MPTPTSTAPPSTMRCPRCGTDNRCALATGGGIERCWCSQGPATLPLPTDPVSACYCADCLRALAETGDAR